MRASLALSVAALLLVSFLHQTSQPALAQGGNLATARKVDEFSDINYEDTAARVDSFAVALQTNLNARGYIIAYRSHHDLPGVSSRYTARIKNYLVKQRDIEANRIVTVDGGGREDLKGVLIEVWLVPAGASPPLTSSTKTLKQVSPGVAYKFDETYSHIPEENSDTDWRGSVEDQAARLDGFARALKKAPSSRGVIMGYAQYHLSEQQDVPYYDATKEYFKTLIDSPSTIRRMLQSDKRYLSIKHGIAASKVITVDGGYRRARVIELWIVPQGAPLPKPMPTIFPRRSRKG